MVPSLRWPPRAVILAAALLVGPGCASIVVQPIEPPDLLRAWQTSIAAADVLSPRTQQTLRRWDLELVYQTNPTEAAGALHRVAVADPQPDLLFALAEIYYLLGRQAERAGSPDACACYYLCAGYAYHYLFEATPHEHAGTAHDPNRAFAVDTRFDPRFRLACDLYNAGLAKCIRAAQQVGRLDPKEQLQLTTSDGKQFTLSIKHHGFAWGPEEFGPFLFNDDYAVSGLENHYRTYGLGVPLIGTRTADSRAPGDAFYPRDVSFPVTAFFRFEGSLAELGQCRSGRLELYNPLATQSVVVHGRRVPLESDLTTPLAYYLAHSGLDRIAYTGFFHSDALAKETGIYLLEPYQRGKIPVLMVHGLLSSPITWSPMFNDLRADPVLRQHFQFWFYLYPTGNPYLTTAADLRAALARLRREVDPQGTDPALDHMVLVGHSMGGLVSRLLTVESGDDFWKLVSDQPFDRLKARPEDRAELGRQFFFAPLNGVERVIFLGTPHHGSELSPSPVSRLAERWVKAPQTIMLAVRDVAEQNPDVKLSLRADRLPTSVDLLAPGAAALELLASRPRPEGVHYHSIIGIAPSSSSLRRVTRWLGETEEKSDGVVPYNSAHLPSAESELIVSADHVHVHQHPLAVLEVRRILLEHLQTLQGTPPPQPQ